MRDDDAALGGGPSHNPVGKPGPVKGGGAVERVSWDSVRNRINCDGYLAEDGWKSSSR